MQFVRDYNSLLYPLLPRILIQTKTDLIKQVTDYIKPTAIFASELGIKMWKECSAIDN
jgi:hypothetical protein